MDRQSVAKFGVWAAHRVAWEFRPHSVIHTFKEAIILLENHHKM